MQTLIGAVFHISELSSVRSIEDWGYYLDSLEFTTQFLNKKTVVTFTLKGDHIYAKWVSYSRLLPSRELFVFLDATIETDLHGAITDVDAVSRINLAPTIPYEGATPVRPLLGV